MWCHFFYFSTIFSSFRGVRIHVYLFTTSYNINNGTRRSNSSQFSWLLIDLIAICSYVKTFRSPLKSAPWLSALNSAMFVLTCVLPNNPVTVCGATSFPGYHSFPKWAIPVTKFIHPGPTCLDWFCGCCVLSSSLERKTLPSLHQKQSPSVNFNRTSKKKMGSWSNVQQLLVYGITRVEKGINRALLTFKATHHIRGRLVRGGPPLSYCFRKPYVISEGRALPTASP